MTTTRLITATSAAALVIASAGFGAFYAWMTGNYHGPVVGALSVVMALGLEGAKPFAIEGAITAARSSSLSRAAALALLGVVAVAYSVTAELSLMAATRADTAAQRTRASIIATAAKARYDAAQRELAALPRVRPVAVLDAEIKRLKTTPKLAPCENMTARDFGPISRRVCAEIATLSSEAGMATRRAELQAIITTAERDIASAPLATDADPAATALAVYLAAIGVPSDAGTLSKWLALVPVLALEVGSALAVVLADLGDRGTVPREVEHRSSAREPELAPERADAAELGSRAPITTPEDNAAHSPVSGPVAAGLSDLGRALLEHLQVHGGIVRSGQRGLAKVLGASTSELHRTIHALAATGTIVLTAAPTGTELRIVA